MEQSITITESLVTIKAQFFVHKDYSFTGKEVIYDVFSKHYDGQQVQVQAFDGENLELSGFLDFLNELVDVFCIPYVIIESHNPNESHGFSKRKLVLGIFVSTGRSLPDSISTLPNSKFVGTMLGRFNPTRLRLAYELDTAFPNDTYITFQSNPEVVENNLRHVSSLYASELNWLKAKVFDRDLVSSHHMGMIDWHTSNATYCNVSNNFQIEVISETDAFSDFWFTEKTARCLALGKPFVLVAGKHSLKQLHNFGFTTFGSIIDERYDNEATPTLRIERLISSLKSLYNDPNRHTKLQELYSLASQNIDRYAEFVSTQREE